jgi:hypothetical protein
MSSALTVLNNTSIQEGGLGIDFSSKFLQAKPANLIIVQPNNQTEGAIKGNLRINETGDQYEEMWATFLALPAEQRQYHIGEPGELNRTPENLMCFSTDMVHPHAKARIPQAVNCASCARQDWGPWREYKEKNDGRTSKALIPPCDAHYRALLIDDKYKLPLSMYLRSKAKEPFEQGMENFTRILLMEQAKGNRPNIFDIKFRIRTRLVVQGKFQFYVPVFSDFRFITPEEREQFGAVYLQYVASKQKKEQDAAIAEAEAEVSTAQNNVDNSMVEGECEYVDGEIKI